MTGLQQEFDDLVKSSLAHSSRPGGRGAEGAEVRDDVAAWTAWLYVPSKLPVAMEAEDCDELVRLILSAPQNRDAANKGKTGKVSKGVGEREGYGCLIRLESVPWVVSRVFLDWLKSRFTRDAEEVTRVIMAQSRGSVTKSPQAMATIPTEEEEGHGGRGKRSKKPKGGREGRT